MDSKTINILLSSFPGLGLPRTLTLHFPASTSISEVVSSIGEHIPNVQSRLVLTTNSNQQLSSRSEEPVSTLLSSPSDSFIPLRLSAPLCGGKGGFGSQLRAAGGRMSSRKKRNQGENNGSNRNLDGRRLRTVAEAKALAEYLAIKPEMDKREKEERKKRWQQVVESAERKQEEAKSGSKAKLDGKWIESKEEAEEKTREAVLAAIKAGEIQDVLQHGSDVSESGSEDSESSENGEPSTSAPQKDSPQKKPQSRTFFGWDEDDEDMSDEDEEEEKEEEHKEVTIKGKGKAKAS